MLWREKSTALPPREPVPWRERSTAWRVLTVFGCLVGCVGIGSMLTLGYIKSAALSQPTVADAVFSHPWGDPPGPVHFLTDVQDRINLIAVPIAFGSWVIVAAVALLDRRLEDKAAQKRLQRLLGDPVGQ